MIRAVNQVTTALLAACLVIGPPILALAWAARQPWDDIGLDDARGWVADPPDDRAIWVLIAAATTGLWLLCTTLVLRAAAGAARRGWQRARRVSLPTPAQATASSLAGTALLGMPVAVIAPADTPPPPTTVGSLHHHDPQPATDASRRDHPDSASAGAGVELPGGGWIPYPTAAAVVAASTLIWLHRRQHYLPDPRRFGRHHRDNDLQALPVTAQAITAALTAQDPAPVPPGPDLAALPALPTGRLTLYGPGAADAARGLLTTTVLHTALDGPAACRVTLGRSALRLLLHTDLPEPLPDGLDIDNTATTSPRPADPADGTSPADVLGSFLLVARHAPAANRPTTSTGGAAPSTPGDFTTLISIGDRPAGPVSWHVRADGTVSHPHRGAAQRLCVLNPAAAVDLLHLVQHDTRSAVLPPSDLETPPAPAPRSSPAGLLTVLGGCVLRIDGAAVHLRRNAGLQILAYLAVRPDGATTTDLRRAVWPGDTANTIPKRLHTTLTDLRQQLQPTIDEPVIRRNDRYLLNTDVIATDLHHLRQSITAARAAFTAQQRRSALQAVIDTYHGELAAGFAWPWLQPAREALRRDVIDAHLLLAESADPAQAVDLIYAAATIDPYNGELHRRGQALLRAAGDQHAADALAQAYTQRLTAAGPRADGPAPRSDDPGR